MKQQFHKIQAKTLDEAYQKMRRKYGNEAIVVGTHQVSERGLLGLLGQKMIEITASVPASPLSGASRKISAIERKYAGNSLLVKQRKGDKTVQYFEQIVRDAQQRMNPAAGGPAGAVVSEVVPFPQPAPDSHSQKDLQREVSEIREMLQVLYTESPGAGLPAEFAPHYRTLIERGVSRRVAAALIGSVVKNSDLEVIRDPRIFVERLNIEIRKRVKVTGGIALHGGTRRIVAFCGATGVGKTTNLAKVAAQFSIRERARVALLTSDTYRVAALEQLRVYANIIGLPLKVMNEAKEAAAVLREFHDHDLVLVDTAGGSQFNLERIRELQGVLRAVSPHETILVLSANTQLEELRNVVNNFKCVHPTSILFTKLDETRQHGALFSLLIESGLPLSYFSIGQNVPDDIRVATPGMVANLLLGGSKNRG